MVQAKTTEVIYSHSRVEMFRRYNKAKLVARSIGGLFPGVSVEPSPSFRDVLEIACGPGGWTIESSMLYPDLRIVGIDIDKTMISFAQSMQVAAPDARFLAVPSMAGPFAFPDASFDLITTTFISESLLRAQWPLFLSECRRLLRPKGKLRITEFDMGQGNSPGHHGFVLKFIAAMNDAQRSFSNTSSHLGALIEIEIMLRRSGFTPTVVVEHPVNYSTGAANSEEWKRDYLILAKEVIPFIVTMNGATQNTIEALHAQQKAEMDSPNFRAMIPMKTVWCNKS